jgi:hypothetical protein
MASKIQVDKISRNSGTPEFTIPTADGTVGQFLKTDGSGVLSFGSGVALTGSTNNTIPTITGANALAGEANFTYDGNTLDIKNAGTASSINLYCETSNLHYIKLKSGPHASATSYTLTLPNAPPATNGLALTATTAGVASWAEAGGGKVLQVIHFQDPGPGVATSVTASWTNTATTAQITCSATTSKVLIMFAGTGYGYRANDSNQYSPFYQLYETATSTAFPGGTPTRFIRATNFQPTAGSSNRLASAMVGTVLHSPSSTSQLTYTVQIKNENSSVSWNETVSEAATITLMEIGA